MLVRRLDAYYVRMLSSIVLIIHSFGYSQLEFFSYANYKRRESKIPALSILTKMTEIVQKNLLLA